MDKAANCTNQIDHESKRAATYACLRAPALCQTHMWTTHVASPQRKYRLYVHFTSVIMNNESICPSVVK